MIPSVLTRYYAPATHPDAASWGLLAVRLTMGAAFALHGVGKIADPMGWMGPDAAVPGVFQALAAVAEFGGGIALMLGLLTPLAAFGILCTMTVALGMVHFPAHHAFVGATPGEPAFELPLIYWALALLLMLVGPGRYALDAFLFRPRSASF
ncbi:MAG: DoxX family protein [Vampirovibrionales bacterium]|nr:DoxX family protein [Vampirovibrionales bacterium]